MNGLPLQKKIGNKYRTKAWRVRRKRQNLVGGFGAYASLSSHSVRGWLHIGNQTESSHPLLFSSRNNLNTSLSPSVPFLSLFVSFFYPPAPVFVILSLWKSALQRFPLLTLDTPTTTPIRLSAENIASSLCFFVDHTVLVPTLAYSTCPEQPGNISTITPRPTFLPWQLTFCLSRRLLSRHQHHTAQIPSIPKSPSFFSSPNPIPLYPHCNDHH